MSVEDRIERARTLYEQAVFSGDVSVLTDAERGLDAVEADTALARGRILHARFQNERGGTDPSAVEDPAELPLFERATELYQALGDVRREAEGLFWIGCLHQFIRRDNETAPFIPVGGTRVGAGGRPVCKRGATLWWTTTGVPQQSQVA